MAESIIEQIKQAFKPAGSGNDALSFAEFEGIVNLCIKAGQEFTEAFTSKCISRGASYRLQDSVNMKLLMDRAEYKMATRASRVGRDFVDEAIEATVSFDWDGAIASYQKAINSFKWATWFINKIPETQPIKEQKQWQR